MNYNHKKIEKKWQKYWEDNKSFKTITDYNKPKFYALDMFPYPSGAGLHVGHPEGYTAVDIVSRMKLMQGYNVLHPMGFDAFGLPAEQYALKTGKSPAEFTYKNIETFKKQMKMIGLSYDWDREVITCDPEYYKWTQWIFTVLYKQGLAEIQNVEVNWCEKLGTVLANEEVLNENGKMVSEIGGHPVVKKPMRQWVLKITEYAEELLAGLDDLDWPENLKEMQRNWIGKSEGAEITFKISQTEEEFTVFTTRPDTLFGATYCVFAPEHPLIKKLVPNRYKKQVEEYQMLAKAKSDLERTDLNKDKTGVFTGLYAINPVNQKEVPIWIADYVLINYGTGAIMAVPAHDQRDYDFAKKFGLEIIPVLDGDISEAAYEGDSLHINSGFLDGLNKEDAVNRMIEYLEAKKIGKKEVNYKLRDWIFSRQRYWGEPFPVVFLEDGSIEVLDEDELPLELPKLKKITPSKTGESPLVHATDWLYVMTKDGLKGKRDTNTMPQWAGSCWYFLAYALKEEDGYVPLSSEKAKKILNYWLPVDLYIGGTEHAVGHLLYSRFWYKVLHDVGLLKTDEPFLKLFNQGMILGSDGEKMSKSKGNVVNPDDIIREFGADSLRLYEMFMGPLEATKPWSTQNIEGPRRFLERVYRLYTEGYTPVKENKNLEKIYHQTVKKVTEDYENLRFNTAISQMMIFINECYKDPNIPNEYMEGFLKLLAPVCPHITEELNEIVFKKDVLLTEQKWPTYDEAKTVENLVTYVFQVNGKIRDRLEVSVDISKEKIESLALASENIQKYIEGKTIRRIIVVPGKLVNIVV